LLEFSYSALKGRYINSVGQRPTLKRRGKTCFAQWRDWNWHFASIRRVVFPKSRRESV